MKPCW